MNTFFLRIFAKRATPRYRRRHVARRLAKLPPYFRTMLFASGVLVGLWAGLAVQRIG